MVERGTHAWIHNEVTVKFMDHLIWETAPIHCVEQKFPLQCIGAQRDKFYPTFLSIQNFIFEDAETWIQTAEKIV